MRKRVRLTVIAEVPDHYTAKEVAEDVGYILEREFAQDAPENICWIFEVRIDETDR
jgi:hypothetical protein